MSSGLFYALTSAAAYGLMSFLVHLNPSTHPVEQLIFLRGLLSFLVLVPFVYREIPVYFRANSASLWIRSFSGAAGVLCYFYALQGTSSGNANLLFSSSPIFVVIFAWFLFRERISWPEAWGIVFIIVGNVLLYLPNRSSIEAWVWFVSLAGALFSSIAFLSLGAATKKYSSANIVAGFAAVSGVLALVIPSKPWLPLRGNDLVFLLAVSGLGLFSQLAATLSFARLKSSVATAIGRSSILFSGFLDMVLGKHDPKALEWLSYLVVIAGILLTQQKKLPRWPIANKIDI